MLALAMLRRDDKRRHAAQNRTARYGHPTWGPIHANVDNAAEALARRGDH